MAKIGDIFVRFGANTKQLEQGVDRSQRKLMQFNKVARSVATSLGGLFAVGIVTRWAGQIAKSVATIETSFTKIETLVGLTTKQVSQFRDELVAVSRVSGRGMEELSDALFTVTSAGLRGAEAMEVMERSAKAAAIGLGDTKEIAKATTAVIQAYGKENINAAEATEILIATVREGNLEASELAPVLGRVVGMAAQLGISFEQVGANIATFTRLGVKADEAVVGLRGVMSALLKPTKMGRDALAGVGLTFEGLRKQIREEGLSKSLNDLIVSFDGNDEALSQLIPNVRALASVLGTAGAQGETYIEIAKNIEKANNLVDGGFNRVSKTINQKTLTTWNKIKTSFQNFGNDTIPILVGALDVLTEGFAFLGRGMKQVADYALGSFYALGKTREEIDKTGPGTELLNNILSDNAKEWRVVTEEMTKAAQAAQQENRVTKVLEETYGGLVKKLDTLQEEKDLLNKTDTKAIAIKNDEILAIERQLKALDKLTLRQRSLVKEKTKTGIKPSIATGLPTAQLDTSGGGIPEFTDEIKELYRVLEESPRFWEQFNASLALSGKELNRIEDATISVAEAFMETAKYATSSADTFGERLKENTKDTISSVKSVIAAKLAETVATTVASAMASVPFPFNFAIGAGAGGAAALLFNSLIPSFAEGGFIPSPTLAMVGDAPGGEYVFNQGQMKDMFSGTQELTARIGFDAIDLTNKKHTEFLKRTTGR